MVLKFKSLGWEDNKNLVLATVLDPHYKLAFFDEFQRAKFTAMLLVEVERIATDQYEQKEVYKL